MKIQVITAFLSIAVLSNSHGQFTAPLKVQTDSSSIHISMKTFVLFHCKDTSKTYFWSRNNDVLKTEGGYEEHLLHGEYVEYYYTTNNLCKKGKFKKGLKHGEWKYWDRQGNLVKHVKYKRGRLVTVAEKPQDRETVKEDGDKAEREEGPKENPGQTPVQQE